MSMSTALICLHGFGENAAVYSPFMNKIKKIIPNSWAVDLPGHGTMVDNDEFRHLKDAPEYIRQRIDAIDADTIILVGTSYGGIVSYILADMHARQSIFGNKKLALIINDVPLQLPYRLKQGLCHELMHMKQMTFNVEQLNEYCIKNGFKRGREPISPKNWQHFLNSFIGEDGTPNYRYDFFANIVDNPKDCLHSNINIIKRSNDYKDWHLNFTPHDTPLLLLIGQNSQFFTDADKTDLIDEQNLMRRAVIPNADHFIDLTNAKVMEYIQTFIQTFIQRTNSQKTEEYLNFTQSIGSI